jgi:lipopolysaccharide biosynthesis protein
LVLANDSVYGPLFSLSEMWESFHGADVYGSIESLERFPHLQSFFLAFDLNDRTRPFLDEFWSDFRYVVPKYRLVVKYELGLSARAQRAGLRIKPYISADSIKQAQSRTPQHQWSHLFERTDINNSLYFYDGLIEHLRFPFLKTVLPRSRSPQHESLTTLRQFVEQKTSYPYAFIQSNVDRLNGGAAAIRNRPAIAARSYEAGDSAQNVAS